MGNDSVEVVRSIYDAFERGDVPAVLAAFANDIEWYEAEGMPYGGLHRGPAAAASKVLGPLVHDIPDFAARPEEWIVTGDPWRLSPTPQERVGPAVRRSICGGARPGRRVDVVGLQGAAR